jgi:CHAT domain-containing protein/tetratricopeptide (TPR) repeat protein
MQHQLRCHQIKGTKVHPLRKQARRLFSFQEQETLMPALCAVLLLASCARPPATAYLGGAGAHPIDLGTDAAGESCSQTQGNNPQEFNILCGTWDQPAARVLEGGPAGARDLDQLAASSSWRAGLERSVLCRDAPRQATVLGAPALLLSCTRRIGGWPHLALVAIIAGRAYYADGVSSALPVMERGIGVASGELQGRAVAAHSISPGLAAQREVASAISASDIGRAEASLDTAASANRAGNYAEAEAAYSAVAALQEHVLGRNDPGLARTLAGEAVQASDLGRYNEAGKLLDRAERLAARPDQPDENALATVWHDRGLDYLNQHKYALALTELRRSEAAYKVTLHGAPLIPADENFASHGTHGMSLRDLFSDPAQHTAIIGVVENQRAEAVALERMNRLGESEASATAAQQTAEANHLSQPAMQASLLRTSAFVSEARGLQSMALTDLTSSSKYFAVAFPGSVVYAQTTLLLAARQADAGQTAQALSTCRAGIAALRGASLGLTPDLLMPCLKLMASSAGALNDEAIHEEMFEAAELAQGSVTSHQIAEASARLMENTRDPRISALIKERADLKAHIADLLSERQEDTQATAGGTGSPLDAAIARAEADFAEKNAALQAASPNFGSLVQQVVSAREVMAALRPGEAFCSLMLAGDGGFGFLITGRAVSIAPLAGGAARAAALVRRIRASLDTETMPPPPFDIAAAQDLHRMLLGNFAPQLQSASALTVAPTGPLLSLPFGLLLTGPASQDRLAQAPWLVQKLVIAHVPAPANFVTLRKLAGTTRGIRPWFGFGDFRPVTTAQAVAAFPTASCGDSASLIAGLPPLPGALVELETVRRLTGAAATDQLLGAAFTQQAVLHTPLKSARILHFATHALLSTDLRCQTEPALVTSAPENAPSAEAALLTASQVTQLDLDADTVILSACNTGGASGGAAGESLSGLARSFFYAGARSMLVTHWAVNDRVTAYLVALAIAEAQRNEDGSLAAGLATAQRKMLADAVGPLAGEAHPFYWAPLALIGDARASLHPSPRA